MIYIARKLETINRRCDSNTCGKLCSLCIVCDKLDLTRGGKRTDKNWRKRVLVKKLFIYKSFKKCFYHYLFQKFLRARYAYSKWHAVLRVPQIALQR